MAICLCEKISNGRQYIELGAKLRELDPTCLPRSLPSGKTVSLSVFALEGPLLF